MLSLIRVSALAVAVVLVAGCMSQSEARVIDGFPLGDAVDCTTLTNPTCEQILDLGRRAFDGHVPSHPGIVTSSLYYESRTNPDTGEPILRSGALFIVIFDLADGSRRATGVHCGVSCSSFTEYPG